MTVLGPALNKLLSIASEPGESSVQPPASAPLPDALRSLLSNKNGFVAFYSALHVRRASGPIEGACLDLHAWNALEVWRTCYARAAHLTLFAEDIFANQFGIDASERVFRLEVESGELVEFAPTLEAWAERVLADHRFETSWPLAEEWQRANGVLLLGQRLVPRTPFVLGGEYEVRNLRVMDEREAVRRYALVAQAIANQPEGSAVVIHGF